jgi:hypothetical protein
MGNGGRSLDFEAFNRFVDKTKSPKLEAALGAPHAPTPWVIWLDKRKLRCMAKPARS